MAYTDASNRLEAMGRPDGVPRYEVVLIAIGVLAILTLIGFADLALMLRFIA